MANRFMSPRFTALDNNGDPISGAKLYFYQSGTTTALDTYSDTTLTTANANPVVADSAGRFGDIFLQAQNYNVILKDASDVEVWSVDPVDGNLSVTGDYFKPAESSPQAMTIEIGAGDIFDPVAGTHTVVAAQTSALMVAPVTNPRYDIVYVDRITGADGTATGTEAASPSDPAIPADKIPVARVSLTVGMTVITTSDITDLRELGALGYPGIKDEDDMASDSATHLATQQSIKAYVDLRSPLRGYIDGLILSNDTDTDHDINVTAGIARSGDDAINVTLATEITKQIDATWTAGDDAGGLADALTVANATWYHVHLLSNADGSTVDVGFDTSITAANLLADTAVIAAGLTKYRRIGAVLTDGSANIVQFFQDGDHFWWKTRKYQTTTTATSATLVTLSTPLGIKSTAIMNVRLVSAAAGGTFTLISSPDETDGAASSTNFDLAANDGTGAFANSEMRRRTNTSSQIAHRSDDASQTLVIFTLGWVDPRGRNG